MWMKNKFCKDVIGGVDENDDKWFGIIVRMNRLIVEDEEIVLEEFWRFFGFRIMVGMKVSSWNGDLV